MADNTTGDANITMTTIASTVDESQVQSVVVSLVHVLILCTTLALNTLLLVVWACTARLRKPPNYLLVVVAGTDLVAAILWCLPSLTASAGWDWILGDNFCLLQGIVSTWCSTVTTTCFMVIALEKAIKLIAPSKHPHTFQKTAVYIMLFSIGIYALVIGLFPVMTFGEVMYIQAQAQCHYLFERSTSHLIFLFTVTYCFPLVICTAFYVGAGVVVWYRKKKSESSRIILEENQEIPHKSFGQRLKETEAKFRNVPQKKTKPKIAGEPKEGQLKADEESSSSELSQLEDDPDEVVTHYVAARYQKAQKAYRKRRVYHLRRRDLRLTLLTLLMTLTYFALWLPFWVVSFLWTFEDISDGLHTAVTLITFVGIAYKPLVYLAHHPFRHAAGRRLCCCIKQSNKTTTAQGYEHQVDESDPGQQQQAQDSEMVEGGVLD